MQYDRYRFTQPLGNYSPPASVGSHDAMHLSVMAVTAEHASDYGCSAHTVPRAIVACLPFGISLPTLDVGNRWGGYIDSIIES